VVGNQTFQASSIELALPAGKAFMHLKHWMWFRSVRTNRNAAWDCEFAARLKSETTVDGVGSQETREYGCCRASIRSVYSTGRKGDACTAMFSEF
jgi:hypothetical protein